ncbi:MAG: DUF5678 domain-containing protein [Anaerolineae bacterium]
MTTTLALQPALWEQLQQTANEQKTDVLELVETAIHTYLRQIEREQIEAEAEAYQKLHPMLTQKYLGQYVAIHHGQVIDHDKDFQQLHARIRQRLGRRPVLLRRVEEAPEREIVFRSPSLEQR